MAAKKQKNDIGKLSFEEALKQLNSIVARIEQGDIALQESLSQYEKGMALIKHCREVLSKTETRIKKISEPNAKSKKSSKS